MFSFFIVPSSTFSRQTVSCVASPKILKKSVSILGISGKFTLKQVRTNHTHTHRCCLLDLAYICAYTPIAAPIAMAYLRFRLWMHLGFSTVFREFEAFGFDKKPWQFILSGPEKKRRWFCQVNPQATLTHSNPRLKSLSGRLGNIFINHPRVSTCHVLGRSLIDPIFFRGWSYRHSPNIFSGFTRETRLGLYRGYRSWNPSRSRDHFDDSGGRHISKLLEWWKSTKLINIYNNYCY